MRGLITITTLLLLIGGFSSFYVWKHAPEMIGVENTAAVIRAYSPPTSPPQPKKTTIMFVGDIMLDRNVKNSVVKNFGGDFSKLFEHATYLRAPDITFANLEGPVSDRGQDKRNLYSFRMDPEVIPVLKDAGFDIFSFANNHVGDWGREAFDDTRARLTREGLRYTGAGDTKQAAATPTIIEKNGTRFGFLGFTDVGPEWLAATDTSGGILLASDPDFNAIIQNAAREVDVLITSFHWGVEYIEHTARQTDLAHRAIDNGATLVVGHHPHVMEATEDYRGGYIVYSLGNYIFDQAFSDETMEGMVFSATFNGDRIEHVDQNVHRLNRFFQPFNLAGQN